MVPWDWCAGSHVELFDRYLKNVSAWTKGEKLADAATGKLNPADEDLMGGVELVLMSSHETAEDFRRGLIAQIGAYKLEHPDDAVDYALLFGGWMKSSTRTFTPNTRRAPSASRPPSSASSTTTSSASIPRISSKPAACMKTCSPVATPTARRAR